MLIEKLNIRQPADSCQEFDEDQTATVELDNAGGGYFVRIKTDNWSVAPEDIDGLARKLKALIRLADKSDKEWDIPTAK